MTIEEMRQRKKELGYSYQRIASLSGLPVGTVQKVLGGITKAPRHETIRSLEAVLSGADVAYQAEAWPEEGAPYPSGSHFHAGCVKEPRAAYDTGTEHAVRKYKKRGQYTLEDYYAVPEDKRMELIDGILYDMAAPCVIHQVLLGELLVQISSYIKGKGGDCLPAVAPLDVQLDQDDRTMVQPDLIVLCDRSKLREHAIYGAPDFIAEVLSPATRRRDLCLKLAKYSGAGVREYWMIDPDKEKIVVYDLEKEELPQVYGFCDQVPMAIFGGSCQIDFAAIDDYLKGLKRL